MKKYETDILEIFLNNDNEFITSQELAFLLSYSDKTIRKYINELNSSLSENGAFISSVRGKGHKIIVQDRKVFEQFQYQNQSKDFTEYFEGDQEDRMRILLNALLLEEKRITTESIVDMFYLSKSSVNTLIKDIRSLLNEYKLSLNYDLEHNLIIDGDEFWRRKFILEYFFKDMAHEKLLTINVDGNEFSIYNIQIVLLEEIQKHQIVLSDYLLNNLALHISLALLRIQKKLFINELEVDYSKVDLKTLDASASIMNRLGKILGLEIPQREIQLLATNIDAKKTRLINPTQRLDDDILKIIIKINSEIHSVMTDQLLIDGVISHIEALVHRLELGVTIKNPLLNEILTNHKEIHELIKRDFKEMGILSGYEIDEGEWAYITIHFLSAIERFTQNIKLRVLVVCATGFASGTLLKNRLQTEFGNRLDVIDSISHYQLNEFNLEEIDFILTTIDLQHFFHTIPVVKVSVFLNNHDIEIVKETITAVQPSLSVYNIAENKFLKDRSELLMALDYLINPNKFLVLEDNTNSKAEIIKTMIQLLDQGNDEQFVNEMEVQLLLRESFGSVQFSQVVAIPHPYKPLGMKEELVVCVIPYEIEWEDSSKVKVIILLSPSAISNLHIQTCSNAIIEFSQSQESVSALLRNPSSLEFKKILLDFA